MRFRDQVKDPDNGNKLFVMIVDECHVGITANQAHDMIVNDFSWGNGDEAQRCKCDKLGKPHPSSGELLSQDNLVTILVSATPYNLLTNKSRLPLKYIFCDPKDSACTVLRKDSATDVWCGSKWKLTAQQVTGLQHQKVSWLHLFSVQYQNSHIKCPESSPQSLSKKCCSVTQHMFTWQAPVLPLTVYASQKFFACDAVVARASRGGLGSL